MEVVFSFLVMLTDCFICHKTALSCDGLYVHSLKWMKKKIAITLNNMMINAFNM